VLGGSIIERQNRARISIRLHRRVDARHECRFPAAVRQPSNTGEELGERDRRDGHVSGERLEPGDDLRVRLRLEHF